MPFHQDKKTLIKTSQTFSCVFLISTLIFFIHSINTEKTNINIKPIEKTTEIMNEEEIINPIVIPCKAPIILQIFDYSWAWFLGIFVSVKNIGKLGII